MTLPEHTRQRARSTIIRIQLAALIVCSLVLAFVELAPMAMRAGQ